MQNVACGAVFKKKSFFFRFPTFPTLASFIFSVIILINFNLSRNHEGNYCFFILDDIQQNWKKMLLNTAKNTVFLSQITEN